MKSIDILLTAGNPATLPVALSGIASQMDTCFRLIVADGRSRHDRQDGGLDTMLGIVQALCGTVEWQAVDPEATEAEKYDHLLAQATADLVLFLDDSVWMAPWTLRAMTRALTNGNGGYVGSVPVEVSAPAGVVEAYDAVDYWEGPVAPELITPQEPEWGRRANQKLSDLYLAGQHIIAGEQRQYKVAWVDQCVLYDRHKLLEVGGFQFWHRLSREYRGAHMIPQALLNQRWGGSAILPSGAYQLVPNAVYQTDPSPEVVELALRALLTPEEASGESLAAVAHR